ncbi:MAG: phytanoyl-CoA dioxygenase family protein [Acidobacteriota bacterium]
MTTKLSKQKLARYDRDGILFPIKVLSADEARSVRNSLEAVASDCGKAPLKRLESLHMFFDWAYRLVTNDALLNAVEGILGGDILVDGTLVFFKPPHNPSYVSWHQDSVYSGWHLTPSTSAWIALTPSHSANGCMRVLPGSHKQGPLDHVNVRNGPNLLERGERVNVTVDENHVVDVILQPGEMSMHQSTLVHGSNPNTSDESRIGFIVRFVTNRSSYRGRPMLRVRGTADCSHLQLASPPNDMDAEEAFTSWRRFCNS